MKKISLLIFLIAQWSIAQNVFPLPSGAVGIGTNAPTNLLHLFTNSNIPLKIESSSNEAYINMRASGSDSNYGALLRAFNNDFGIYHGNGVINSLYIKGSNGNMGIGTSNPEQKLSLVDNSGNQFIASYIGGKIYQDYKYTAISYGQSPGSFGNSSNIGYMSHQVDKSLSGLYFTNYGESEQLSSLFIRIGGNVGIGTINPNNKLDVNGTIHSKEVKVDMNGWSDFVFKKDYTLPTLQEVEKHIAEKGHLENIPSEEEVLKNGINLGEMNAKLLQKIEEMTLYLIMIEKDKENQNKEIEELKGQNKKLELMNERLAKLEEKLK